MYMISSNLLLLFNINYIKSWIHSNLMEIGFYSNKRKIEKNNCRRYDLNQRPSEHMHDALASTAIRDLHFHNVYLITKTRFFLEATPGIEPGYKDLQSSA